VIRALREGLHSRSIESLAPHWVRELARLLPEVQMMRSGIASYSADTIAAPSRLYEAVCQAFSALLAGIRPGVLLFEDTQWADSATLDLTAYWLRRPASAQELGVFTRRSEEIPRAHRLRLLLADYGRDGGQMTFITPQRLSRTDVQGLVSAVQLPADPDLLERIYAESEGLPLFVHEYLALLYANPALQREVEWGMPLEIHELLRSRVSQVSEIARQILDTAAVIRRSFDLELVRECSGRGEEETVDGADELERRGILRDGGGSVPIYEFCHEKLRAVVYQELSMARRRLLHRRAAQTILNRVGQTDKLPATAALIAAHFQSGGQDVYAADHYVLAGRHARGLYANRDALTYFERALALGYPHPTDLYQHIGDLYTMLGNYRVAIRSYETGIAHAGAEQVPALEQMLGRVYHRLGEWELADSYYQSSLHTLSPDALVERASLLTDRSLTKYAIGDIAQANELAQAALDTAERTTNAWVKAQANNMMGLLARKHDQYDQAYTHLHESLHIAETLNDVGIHIAALNNLALMYMETGQHEEAQHLFETALEKCVHQGDLHREAALHNNLADLLHTLQAPEAAMKHLKAAVILFAQVGRQDNQMRPEIWKLAEW
jgi:tetratricopeptide (TPR) repeat protein